MEKTKRKTDNTFFKYLKSPKGHGFLVNTLLMIFLGFVLVINLVNFNLKLVLNIDFFSYALDSISISSPSIMFRIFNVISFFILILILKNTLKKNWKIFTLVAIFNPATFFFLTSDTNIFTTLVLSLMPVFLYDKNKKFSFFSLLLFEVIFMLKILPYTLFFLAFHLLNKKMDNFKFFFLRIESKELFLSLSMILIGYLIRTLKPFSILQDFMLPDFFKYQLNINIPLVILVFAIIGLFIATKEKMINLFQTIALVLVAIYLRRDMVFLAFLNVVATLLAGTYLLNLFKRSWKNLDLKKLSVGLVFILLAINFSQAFGQTRFVYEPFEFNCSDSDYILTDVKSTFYAENLKNNCIVDSPLYYGIDLSQREYLDKINPQNLNYESEARLKDDSDRLKNLSDFDQEDDELGLDLGLSNSDFNDSSDYFNIQIIDIVLDRIQNNEIEISTDSKITQFEKSFFESNREKFFEDSLKNKVKFIVFREDEIDRIWEYNFGLISYYDQFRFFKKGPFIIVQVYS